MITHMICSQRGSDAVKRDAWAEWDPVSGEWELGSVFDDAYCESCEAQSHLTSYDIDQPLEIEVCPMVVDGQGARLTAHRGEAPDHFDIALRQIEDEHDEARELLERDGLTLLDANAFVEYLTELFPSAGLTWHHS